MAKTFYTEHDIQDLAAQGVQSLRVDDNTVLTELAREAARKLGIQLAEGDDRPSSAPQRPYLTDKVKAATAGSQAAAPPSGSELEQRVYNSVKKRLGDQVDESLLKAIVQRVLKKVGGK